jgi:class 3 adenylate cyclase
MASSTVREIVTGSRRTFTDRGEYQLKGVSGRWRLHTLVREVAAVSQ